MTATVVRKLVAFAAMGALTVVTWSSVVAAQECPQFEVALTTTPAPSQISRELARHAAELTQPPSQTLVIGDSMIQRWPAELVATAIGSPGAANFGIASDRLQNVLYRLPTIWEVQPNPATVVLWAGTNNVAAGEGACAVITGVLNLVYATRELWPTAEIVLLGIVPRGIKLNDRDAVRLTVNNSLSGFQVAGGYRFVDPSDALRCTSSDPSPSILALLAEDRLPFQCRHYERDHVHLSARGYDVLSAAVAARR